MKVLVVLSGLVAVALSIPTNYGGGGGGIPIGGGGFG